MSSVDAPCWLVHGVRTIKTIVCGPSYISPWAEQTERKNRGGTEERGGEGGLSGTSSKDNHHLLHYICHINFTVGTLYVQLPCLVMHLGNFTIRKNLKVRGTPTFCSGS
ncbi:hypothetical protein XELAEV_18026622mg [Xenopus laevis]|uniref:Uncharacterized protein n=1 Tax=Xenopus laevis TaxID=8355 RepID=A0A974CWJ4_XENLA|nr:hypothetical protein XELAEV_18026622mg [Xenopus laevis]